MAKPKSIEDQLRAAIEKDPRSLYRIARDAQLGIGPTQRFAASIHGITMRSAVKMAATLGLELKLVRRSKRKGGAV